MEIERASEVDGIGMWEEFGMRKKLERGRSHETWKGEKSEGQLKRAVGERAVEPFELRPEIVAVDGKIGRPQLVAEL